MRSARAAHRRPRSPAGPGVAVAAALAALSGCVGPRGRTWDFDGATMRRIGWAAWDAAASPEVLLPAAGAAIFQVDDWDDKVSRWAGDRTPIFGSQSGAEEASDLFIYGSLAVAGAAVLAVPTGPGGAYTWDTKVADLGGAGAALGATLGVTEVLQHEVGRERPHGGQKTSFPSSHASGAAAANALTSRYVEYLPAPEWAKWTMDGALLTATYATGWARVEARKHHPSDALAGIAIGAFAARFANELLELDAREDVQVSAAPLEGGVAFALTIRW